MRLVSLSTIAFTCLWIGCATPNMETGSAEPDTSNDMVGDPELVLLRGVGGNLVSCELGREGKDHASLFCNRPDAGEWERFQLYHMKGGKVALKAANGLFVSSDFENGKVLVANRGEVGEWELFTLEDQGSDHVAIKAWDGYYVSADLSKEGAQKGILVGDRVKPEEWELFRIEKIEPAAE
ncbi:MAG: hypothetical protein IPH05_03730 [Flavobacteriales bacterium]|jgi:hypothetical protein|nr:hypothetical protein [Flavobacteriales bacterium]MBK6551524.1 hypothetical protein [Flavobacteriales bacterium]MBK6882048.1 hypothetical protein [Flavobacteriales bacterium]MBK7103504.1 hypothetical protein [Flavobacteriales bacterium]MBK7481560.1 hypothetical protein [Flavobacteriales bacterium]